MFGRCCLIEIVDESSDAFGAAGLHAMGKLWALNFAAAPNRSGCSNLVDELVLLMLLKFHSSPFKIHTSSFGMLCATSVASKASQTRR